jgi:hypothetical protein
MMSSESEPGDNFERGGRIGCDASPILQLGEHAIAIDDVSALLGGVITRVGLACACPKSTLPACGTVATVDYEVIRRSCLPAGASLPTAAAGRMSMV